MKIAYLLQHGYEPSDIIALTFTKKAATEMQNRIQELVGAGRARRLWMGTFHSLFSRILRREAERIGFPHDFTIYDQQDSRNLVKAIIKEMGLDDKQYKPNSIQAIISNAKNNLVTPSMYMANRELIMYDQQARRPRTSEIYVNYWNRCQQAGAMDFDDLLLYTNILFRDHPDVLQFYQDYFKYVLVDEYQDTNRAQHMIVEQLSRQHRHLCVVGDDAQSIYSFRGANIRNILDLSKQIPDIKIFKLEQNYRSTQNIVDAANSLISKNREQIRKTIFSQKERGSLLRLSGSYSDLEEAYQVAQRIEALHKQEGFHYADCAVLYRTNAQSRTLEEALRKRGIEYRIFGGLSFYQRKEIKDVLAYLRLIINPADEESFKRVVNYPARGIGDTTVGKLVEAMRTTGTNLFEVCSDPVGHSVAVNRGTEKKLTDFAQMIRHFQELNQTLNAYELTSRVVIESCIKADLAGDTSIEAKSRRENVEELLTAIQTFVISGAEEGNEHTQLVDFLADVSLSGDVEPNEDENTNHDYVAMMTIHQAKGLEFQNVFIVGIEEDLLPSDMSIDEPNGVEEERRLFYVAITRAEQNCFLSYARSRFRNGQSKACRPSRFLKDIDQRFVQTLSSPTSSYGDGGFSTGGGTFGESRTVGTFSNSYRPEPQRPAEQPRRSVLDLNHPRKVATRPTDALSHETSITFGGHLLEKGTRIVHDRFGKGTITDLSGTADNARINVHFDTMGDKTLLLKFAKFTLDK